MTDQAVAPLATAPHKNAHIGPNHVIGFIRIRERCRSGGGSTWAGEVNVSIVVIFLFGDYYVLRFNTTVCSVKLEQ